MASIAATALVCSFTSSLATNALLGYEVRKHDWKGGIGISLIVGPIVGSPIGAVGVVGKASLFIYKSGITMKSAVSALAGGILSIPIVAGGALAGSIVGGIFGVGIASLFYKREKRTIIDQFQNVYQQLKWQEQEEKSKKEQQRKQNIDENLPDDISKNIDDDTEYFDISTQKDVQQQQIPEKNLLE